MEKGFEFNGRGRRFRLGIPVMIVAFFVAGALAVMLLWNAIIPELIPTVGHVNYLQALGLLALCKILFGGFRGRPPGRHFGRDGFRGGPPPPWKQKMMDMTDEEREKFKAEWRERCHRK